MSPSDESVPEPGLGSFLEEPSDDLKSWAEVWEGDHFFPIRTHRAGLAGRLIIGCKRLARFFRPLVSMPQADLWERQRIFDQVLIRHLGALRSELAELAGDVERIGKDLQQVQHEITGDLRKVQSDMNGNTRVLAEELDDFRRKGMVDVMRHTDALFARLDQKVDRLRRRTNDLAAGSSADD